MFSLPFAVALDHRLDEQTKGRLSGIARVFDVYVITEESTLNEIDLFLQIIVVTDDAKSNVAIPGTIVHYVEPQWLFESESDRTLLDFSLYEYPELLNNFHGLTFAIFGSTQWKEDHVRRFLLKHGANVHYNPKCETLESKEGNIFAVICRRVKKAELVNARKCCGHVTFYYNEKWLMDFVRFGRRPTNDWLYRSKITLGSTK
jgi:hypothetical protein